MRRLSFKQRIRSSRLAKKRAARQIGKSAAHSSAKRVSALSAVSNDGSTVAPETKSATWRGINYQVPVFGEARAVPAILCLDKNREESLKFLAQVRSGLDHIANITTNRSSRRKAQHRPPQTIGNYWDLSCVRNISPEFALMLAAEYERLHDLTGWRSSAIDAHKWHMDVFSLLEDIGYFRLLEIRRSPAIGNLTPNTVVLKFRSAKMANGTETGKLIDALERIANEHLPNSSVDFDRLAGAVLEGITNTKQHAYPAELAKTFRFTNRWWATGVIDKDDRRISAIIYDQGASIPATIMKAPWFPRLVDAVKRLTSWRNFENDDGALIAGAMAVGRSHTKLPHRGKGLADMESFMRTCNKGRLSIRSRSGEYISNAVGDTKKLTHSSPIPGTLVQWDVWV